MIFLNKKVFFFFKLLLFFFFDSIDNTPNIRNYKKCFFKNIFRQSQSQTNLQRPLSSGEPLRPKHIV